MTEKATADAAEKETPPPSNLERLQGHMTKDTLAERLVAARVAAGDGDARAALRQVILDRLGELKRKHEPVQDQQA